MTLPDPKYVHNIDLEQLASDAQRVSDLFAGATADRKSVV